MASSFRSESRTTIVYGASGHGHRRADRPAARARGRADGCSPPAGRTLARAAKMLVEPGSEPGEGRDAEAREQAQKLGDRQAHDVEVVAVDALHERRADALDGVGAGPALPLAGADVGGELPVGEAAEGHAGHGVRRQRPSSSRSGTGRCTPRGGVAARRRTKRPGLGLVARLAEDLTVADHHGVHAEHQLARLQRLAGEHLFGLAAGVLLHRVRRVPVDRRPLRGR